MKKRKKHTAATRVLKAKPTFRGWRTTDEEEVERRRLRASMEPISIEPLEPDQSFYGTFGGIVTPWTGSRTRIEGLGILGRRKIIEESSQPLLPCRYQEFLKLHIIL